MDSEDVAAVQNVAKPPKTLSRGLNEIVKTAFLALFIFTLARTVVLPYEVEGSSMSPNLQNGERVLVNRSLYFHFDLNGVINWIPGENRQSDHEVYLFHQPQRGEVLVLNPPVQSDKPYIKRNIAEAGEHISFQDGYVHIDGERLDEPYINGAITDCRGQYCDMTIPAGYVYVLGDNRENSQDSRYFGPVPIGNIIGKAWFSNWPMNDFGRLPRYKYGLPS